MENLLNIDIILVIAFLIATLYVGVRHSRGIKTIKDYALGGRNFSTFALVATISATWIGGGSFFTTLSKVYSDGLYYLIPAIFISLSLVLIAFVLVPRMGMFLGKISVAEAMGELYGKHTRIIVAIAGAISASGSIAIQFKALGNILSHMTDINDHYIIILFGMIVVTYSVFGGIRGVTFTDILQFLAFGIAIPIVGLILWNKLGGKGISFANAINHDKFDLNQIFNIKDPLFYGMLPLIFYFSMPGLEPAIFQRISMGKNIAQVKKAFAITVIISLVVKLTTSWIPFLLLNVKPDLAQSQLLGYIINNYSVTGVKALILIGVTAMAMSTADSHMNITSVLFVNDICKFITKKSYNELLLLRIFTFIIGVSGIALALNATDLLKLILATRNFYIPVVTIPLIMTILGFRTNGKCVLLGMYGGIITVLIWKGLSVEGEVMPLASLVNMLLLFGSHYLSGAHGGWTHTRCEYLSDLSAERRRKLRKIISIIKSFRFLEFCRNNAPESMMTYSWFGIYCIIYSLATMYSTHEHMIANNDNMILYFYQIMLCTGTLMASFPIWPYSVEMHIKENIVRIWWPIAIFYMMFFFNIFFLAISNFGELQLLLCSMNIIFAMLLIGWRTSLIMFIVGIFSALKMYKYYKNIDVLPSDLFYSQSNIIYAVVILCSGTLIFIKQYQDKQDIIKKKNEYLEDKVQEQRDSVARADEMKNELLRNIQHESQTPMTIVYGHLQTLDSQYEIFDEETRRDFIAEARKEANKFMNYTRDTQILADSLENTITLTKEAVNLSDMIYEIIDENKSLHISEEQKNDRIWDVKIAENLFVHCDKKYVKKAISNLVENAIKYCENGKIIIRFRRGNHETVEFTISDEGCGLPDGELQDIFQAFMTSSETRKRSEGKGLGLAVAKNVIQLHKGNITAYNNEGKKGATFYFMLPVMT